MRNILSYANKIISFFLNYMSRFLPGCLLMAGMIFLEKDADWFFIFMSFFWAFFTPIVDIIFDKQLSKKYERFHFYKGYNAGCSQIITAMSLNEKMDKK